MQRLPLCIHNDEENVVLSERESFEMLMLWYHMKKIYKNILMGFKIKNKQTNYRNAIQVANRLSFSTLNILNIY